ncbi:class I SAM-dependent methyltransferase [Terasakiella sp. A23]|uniref:O-methyltransferase n=1 Tax=Terasakiella sp. FCG-A23 TaxID=3080561 RepID=UPI002954CDDD|nr:class I SAM-dependent methyltransferase [Terasakiella sp. A23]MDV7341676.1 class I SAM-dependent methyltransferase [Terasakiella sp. A23]
MADSSLRLTDGLDAYIRKVGMRESEPLRRLREKSKATLVNAQLAIMPEEACFLDMLVRITGTKRIIEFGVYAGYSTLALAQALPDDGYIVALERDERFPPVGQPYWKEAGVDHKIDLRLCDANEEIETVLKENGPESFDFAFIDADKASYMNYYEKSLELVKPGGIICVDNVLWYGRVIDENDTTHQTAAIRAINEHIVADERVDMSMLAIGDGLTIVRKR